MWLRLLRAMAVESFVDRSHAHDPPHGGDGFGGDGCLSSAFLFITAVFLEERSEDPQATHAVEYGPPQLCAMVRDGMRRDDRLTSISA